MAKAANTYFLNADKSKTVDEDSPDAAFLLVREGGSVSDEDVEKYGVKVVKDEPAAESTSEGEPAVDDSVDLESKTKAELLEMAGARGVDVKTSQTKAEILAALQGE